MDLRFIFDLSLESEEVLCVFRKDKSYAAAYRKLINKFCSQNLNVISPDSISEYSGSANHYIDVRKYNISDYSQEDFDIFKEVIDIPSILRKDRMFRTHLNYYQAYDLIISTTKFFIEFFKNRKYKIIVIQSIDNYVGDILTRVAGYFNIDIIGVSSFFYSGYVRITVQGEHNTLRNVSDDEVEIIYRKMLSREKTAFKINKNDVYREIIRQYFTYKAKYLIHYLIFHKLMRKWEYDYVGTPSFPYPNKLRNFFTKKYFEKNLSRFQYFEKKEMVYIPMHFFPEATTEYWVESPDISPYYPSLFEIVQTLANKGYKIIIKEHPAFYLKRDLSIYKKLKSINNVFLIDPFTSTYDVMDLVDYLVVWTGTAGIEAIMQDKKVAVASENYYSNNRLPRFNNIEKAVIFNELEKKEIIKRVLENCLQLSIN